MKTDCDIIRDLLPLYAEGMVSEKTKALVEEHIAECGSCRRALEEIRKPMPQAEYNKDQAESFKRYVRKRNLRFGGKVAAITALCVLAAVALRLAASGILMSVFMISSASSKVETDTDPAHYSRYMGETAEEKYRSKWGMDESIFPESLDGLDTEEYTMVYYDPWDKQFLSYLTVRYDESAYAAERERLRSCGVTQYKGYYGVTGFSGGDREPLAMYADDYSGFVYAIDTPGREGCITYVELIFCNYCYDLDYGEYISEEYLPEGFDAKPDNAYMKKMEEEEKS